MTVNGNKNERYKMGENFQADIISSIEANTFYGKEYLELISYEKGGKTHKTGLVFTTIADDAEIAAIKAVANKISDAQKNGIYLSYASQTSKTGYKWLIGTLIFSFALLVLVGFLFLRIRRIRKENEADKMTDTETGMGNLQFFKYHLTVIFCSKLKMKRARICLQVSLLLLIVLTSRLYVKV